MKAALVCFVLLTLFVLFSWYFIVPYLGAVLLGLPLVIVILGARDVWHAIKAHTPSTRMPELRPN